MTSSSADQNRKDWDAMTAESRARSAAASGASSSTASSSVVSSPVVIKALWAFASLPIVASLLLASLAVRSRLANGSWPSIDNPDPKTFGVHYDLALVGFIAAFAAVLIVPILALVAFVTGNRRVTIRPMIVAFLSFALYFLFIRIDIGGIGEWFAD